MSGESYNSERLKPSVKHSGHSLKALGYMSVSFVGDLAKIDGIINTNWNLQILIHHAIPSEKLLIGNAIFQPDSDPKDTAKAVKEYLDK